MLRFDLNISSFKDNAPFHLTFTTRNPKISRNVNMEDFVFYEVFNRKKLECIRIRLWKLGLPCRICIVLRIK